MSPRRKAALAATALLLVCSLTTACTLSLGSGLFGLVAAITLGGLLLGFGGTAATTGCTQVCLSSIPFDQGVDQGKDAGVDLQPDGPVGPCLSRPTDQGGETPAKDAGGDSGDGPVGPCLGAPLDAAPDSAGKDASAALAPAPSHETKTHDRRALLARHGDALPADVRARLARDARGDRPHTNSRRST